jgi:hypothetical protein
MTGAVALDLLAGLISLEGSVDISGSAALDSSLEFVAVQHRYQAFEVTLNPDTVSNVISKRTLELLCHTRVVQW